MKFRDFASRWYPNQRKRGHPLLPYIAKAGAATWAIPSRTMTLNYLDRRIKKLIPNTIGCKQ
jgi:hypothetical protein